MWPINVEDDIADLQIRDLRNAESAAARQAEDDQVPLCVQRSLRFGIGENCRQFAAGEDFCGIDVPGGRVHGRSPVCGATEIQEYLNGREAQGKNGPSLRKVGAFAVFDPFQFR